MKVKFTAILRFEEDMVGALSPDWILPAREKLTRKPNRT